MLRLRRALRRVLDAEANRFREASHVGFWHKATNSRVPGAELRLVALGVVTVRSDIESGVEAPYQVVRKTGSNHKATASRFPGVGSEPVALDLLTVINQIK